MSAPEKWPPEVDDLTKRLQELIDEKNALTHQDFKSARIVLIDETAREIYARASSSKGSDFDVWEKRLHDILETSGIVVYHPDIRPHRDDSTKKAYKPVLPQSADLKVTRNARVWRRLRLSRSKINETKTTMPRPPFNAEYLLYLVLRKEERAVVLGDLIEGYSQVLKRFNKRRADIWFYKQVVGSIFPLLRRQVLRIGALVWLGRILRQLIS